MENKWDKYPGSGFKRLLFKIGRTPFFLWNAATYAPRRRNSIWRICEALIGLLIVFYLQTWWSIAIAFIAEIVAYEAAYAIGWTGPYFNRGPREEDLKTLSWDFRNDLWRLTESLIGYGIVFYFPERWSIALAFFCEFAAYEWIAEPMGWTGYYWERAPRNLGESPFHDGFWAE